MSDHNVHGQRFQTKIEKNATRQQLRVRVCGEEEEWKKTWKSTMTHPVHCSENAAAARGCLVLLESRTPSLPGSNHILKISRKQSQQRFSMHMICCRSNRNTTKWRSRNQKSIQKSEVDPEVKCRSRGATSQPDVRNI